MGESRGDYGTDRTWDRNQLWLENFNTMWCIWQETIGDVSSWNGRAPELSLFPSRRVPVPASMVYPVQPVHTSTSRNPRATVKQLSSRRGA